MRKRGGWILAACLLLAAPTYVLAISNHFPNDQDLNTHNVCQAVSCAGHQEVALAFKQGKCPDVTTQLVSVDGFKTTGIAGALVVAGPPPDYPALARKLCIYANNNGYNIQPGSSPATCAGIIDTALIDMDFGGDGTKPSCGAGDGFTILKAANSDFFEVVARGTVDIKSLITDTPPGVGSPGNTIGMDLLSDWIVRVNPDPAPGMDENGQPADPPRVDGIVHLSVKKVITGKTYGFDVDTNNMTDDAIHDSIAAGLNGLSGSDAPRLQCKKHNAPEAQHLSGQPMRERGKNRGRRASYEGSFVRCKAINNDVEEFSVSGVPGQEIIQETTSGPGPSQIPTLSTWGLALLLGALLLIGTWMLARRQTGQTA